ncbi:enterotoxin A family protein [Xenorhabdus kozodoii]|uniref:Pertussis toxin subunit 1 n=1 Tax=Xenorhabdus kozodoii TaxID=351676 RepID=A0A2D0LCS8_9GAMM|nr:enterotoxin A family protein [Xenorhabdus kozodoii]PHM73499.1 pertussis toxin subunit 1 precursor [Xenorhabdus kozodoii]
MRILKFLYLLCVVFLYTAQSYAQPPITKVYRVDSRPLERIIRAGGFHSRGTNDDIARHVQGPDAFVPLEQETPADLSAFVATSTNREFTYEFGGSFPDDVHDPFYIYDIRPTANFYSVVLTLEHLYQQTGNDEYRRLISVFGDQAEYAAFGSIDISQVHGAQRYVYVSSRNTYVRNGDYIPNPSYQEAETYPNTGPYIQQVQSPSEIITSETYCASNWTSPTSYYPVRHAASTHEKYPFLTKLKVCHDSLSTIAFLNACFL